MHDMLMIAFSQTVQVPRLATYAKVGTFVKTVYIIHCMSATVCSVYIHTQPLERYCIQSLGSNLQKNFAKVKS